jgi:hypothetical protein
MIPRSPGGSRESTFRVWNSQGLDHPDTDTMYKAEYLRGIDKRIIAKQGGWI